MSHALQKEDDFEEAVAAQRFQDAQLNGNAQESAVTAEGTEGAETDVAEVEEDAEEAQSPGTAPCRKSRKW